MTQIANERSDTPVVFMASHPGQLNRVAVPAARRARGTGSSYHARTSMQHNGSVSYEEEDGMPYMVEPGSVLNLGKETMEFTATPAETGDRYCVRMTVARGGGPGVRGFGPHIHDGFTETFTVVAGTMRYRRGRTLREAHPGQRVEVPPGAVHGFRNVGDDELTVDVEIIFGPEGPTRETDPVPLGVTVARLMEEGRVSRFTGFPPILQLAVVENATPNATREAGLPGLLMPSLAWLGRRLGYKPDPFAADT